MARKMTGFVIGMVAGLAVSACAPTPPVQSLRMAYPHELVTLDPHRHADAVTDLVLSAVYESLVRFESGQPVKPGLADRWPTPDESTWHDFFSIARKQPRQT